VPPLSGLPQKVFSGADGQQTLNQARKEMPTLQQLKTDKVTKEHDKCWELPQRQITMQIARMLIVQRVIYVVAKGFRYFFGVSWGVVSNEMSEL
jgi:hypothetical protein